MSKFGKELIQWYNRNKRDLPWRQTKDPYRIWLSEVILQQTRVEQGRAYYLKFLELFPTVFDLANAPQDVVLKAWQGLGYYSRARNLHLTAQIIATEYDGKFPERKNEIIQLKGVGDYTASAIASFCFDEISPVIDGNVVRVLSRLFAIEFAADTPQGIREIRKVAEELIDTENPGIYNQAIMEFGSQQCTPRSPDCISCPFAVMCKAFQLNAVQDFPKKKKKVAVTDIYLHYFVVKTAGGVYLKKRDDTSIWKGLYDFPSSEQNLSTDMLLENFMKTIQSRKMPEVLFISEEYRHLLTHRKITARFYEIGLKRGIKNLPDEWILVDYGHIGEYPVPRLIDKYLHDRGFYS